MPDVVLYPATSGWGAHDVRARSTYGTRDVFLRARPAGDAAAWGRHDVRLYPAARYVAPYTPGGGPAFPTQYAGLRVWHSGAVVSLCMVAVADAPSGMGGQPRVWHGGVERTIYLVETTDPDASPVRVRTSAGTKAIRRLT